MAAIRKCTGNFVATQVDDEILIVDLEGCELFSLTGTAKAVWQAIDGQRSEEEIARQMAQLYEADPQVISGDVAGLLGQFEDAALIERGQHKPL